MRTNGPCLEMLDRMGRSRSEPEQPKFRGFDNSTPEKGLQCQNISVKGNKANLVVRWNKFCSHVDDCLCVCSHPCCYIYFSFQSSSIHKEADNIVDTDGKHLSQQLQVSLSTPDWLPTIDVSSAVWKPLKETFPPRSPINFTNAEIVNYMYFVLRRAIDGMPARDIKEWTIQHWNCSSVVISRICM